MRVQVKNLSSDEGYFGMCFSEIRGGEIVWAMAGLVGSGRYRSGARVVRRAKRNSGEVLLDAVPTHIESPADAIGQGIAFLTEDRKRIRPLASSCRASGTSPLQPRRDRGMKYVLQPSRESAESAKLGTQMNVKWSSPQALRQFVSLAATSKNCLIARWLMAGSRFMIFDEPTRGIDVGAKREFIHSSTTSRRIRQGHPVLFRPSCPSCSVVDRILVMRCGKLVGNLETKKPTPTRSCTWPQ